MSKSILNKGITLFLTAPLLALVACGSGGQGVKGQEATVNLIKGSGQHIVTGNDVNVRDETLSVVLFVARKGDTFSPTREGFPKVGSVGNVQYKFHEVTFDKNGITGWVADGVYVQPYNDSGTSSTEITDFSFFSDGSGTVITAEDDGGLNCRTAADSNSVVMTIVPYDQYFTVNYLASDSRGKSWASVTYSRHHDEKYVCFLRATTDRLRSN